MMQEKTKHVKQILEKSKQKKIITIQKYRH